MKKVISLLVVLVMGLCVISSVNAEAIDVSDMLEKAPEVKEGYLYSFDDAKGKISTSFDLIEYGDLAVELGVIAEDNEAFIAMSYHLINLKEDKGVTTWILDLVDISIAIGYGLKEIGNNNEGDFLLGATLFKMKI